MTCLSKETGNRLSGFDEMPDIARVRIDTVAQLLSCSTRTVRHRIEAGVVPAPAKEGGILTWRVGDLRHALGKPLI
jgi:hypothetical protein